MATVTEVVELLDEVREDSNTTKNLREKLTRVVNVLKADGDVSLKINKASQELDEIASNSDLDSFTRTQLLGIVGALETVEG